MHCAQEIVSELQSEIMQTAGVVWLAAGMASAGVASTCKTVSIGRACEP